MDDGKIRPCRPARSSSLRSPSCSSSCRPTTRLPGRLAVVRRGRLSAGVSDVAHSPRTADRRRWSSSSRSSGWRRTCGTRSTPRAARRAPSRRAKASRSCCPRAISCARWPCWRPPPARCCWRSSRASEWLTVLSWWHQTPFAASDPILGRNVAFYIFTLPLLELARGLALALVALAAIGSAARLRVCRRTGAHAVRPPDGAQRAPAWRHARAAPCSSSSRLARGSISRAQLVTASGIIQGASYTDVLRAHAGGTRADGSSLSSAPCSAWCTPSAARRGGWSRRSALYAVVAGRRRALRVVGSALRRRAQRTGARDAVHPAQHRGDAAGLRARSDRGARADRRRRTDPRRHRAQPRNARQRPALGSPAAARDVRTDPGDPHLLRLHLGRQRSLRRQRPHAAGDAVGPRAEPGGAAQPHVDQRTARLHARPRADARPGEPGDRRRTAGALHSRPAAGVDDQHADHASRASTSASCRTSTSSPAPGRASFTTPRAKTTSTPITTGAAACRCRRSCASCCSPRISARTRSC